MSNITDQAARSTPLLVVVSGQPGSGKTTLARGLARELGLPLIGRDDLKEVLFDDLGWSDRAWSIKLGMAAYDLLYLVARAMLAGGASLIVESNFNPERGASEINRIAAETGARLVQALCRADGQVLYDRYLQRMSAPDRHPGHVNLLTSPDLAARLLHGEYPPLALDGPLVVVDTNDFANADPVRVAHELRAALGQED